MVTSSSGDTSTSAFPEPEIVISVLSVERSNAVISPEPLITIVWALAVPFRLDFPEPDRTVLSSSMFQVKSEEPEPLMLTSSGSAFIPDWPIILSDPLLDKSHTSSIET